MSDSRGADVLFLALLLILPASALIARRVPLGQTLKMALGWLAIFGVGFVIVSQRHRLEPMWRTQTGGVSSGAPSGTEVRVAIARDGHFWVDARINGIARQMLVDSGATTTAISRRTADAAGVPIDDDGFPIILDTANGEIAALPAIVQSLRIDGLQTNDLPVVVSDGFGDTDVLGMNFLSRLRAWQVDGDVLILTPR